MTIENKIIEWAKDRGVFEKSNPIKQQRKTVEKMGELFEAINKPNNDDIKMELGDIYVTLVLQAKMQGVKDISKHPVGVGGGLDMLPWHIGTISRGIVEDEREAAAYSISASCQTLKHICVEMGLDFNECAQSAYDKIRSKQ